MQAVILVGGEGTRLRPLTSTVPKPVVPLVDRPFISFMLEWLKGHGIDDVIMSCGFLATSVRNVLGDGSGLGIRLRFVEEPDPRGTAGALKFAESMLDERFLMLNGDVLTDIDLTAQIAQHERTGARATLALVPVEDPTAYGLVHLEEDHSVRDFLEKPSPDHIEGGAAGRRPASRAPLLQSYTNLISAGAYVLEREILDLVPPDCNVSIERGVSTAEGAHVGSLVVLGQDVSIGEGSTVERAVIMNGAEIGAGCTLRDCIVAAGARVGAGTRITGGAGLGEGVTVGADNVIAHGARIFPGVTLPDGAIKF